MANEFNPKSTVLATTVFIIISILILITILFEISKEWLLDKSTKYTKPIYQQLFSEMTVLGFLSLITFMMCLGGTLDSISSSIFGEDGKLFLQESLEQIHYLIFIVMILTIIQVMLLGSIVNQAMNDFDNMNVISQDDKRMQLLLQSIDNERDYTFVQWICDYIYDPLNAYTRHNKRKKLESTIIFYALRHEFIRHRSIFPPYDILDQSTWLPLNFDFGIYQSKCMSLLLVDVVNFTPSTWLAIWLITSFIYIIMLVCEDNYLIFSLVWLLFGYIDLLGIFIVNVKCHDILLHLINPDLFRSSSELISYNQLDIQISDDKISIDNKLNDNVTYHTFPKRDSLSSSSFIYSPVLYMKYLPHTKPLYTAIEESNYSYINKLFGHSHISNKQLQLFWGGNIGPQLNVYLLRIHLIIESVYITLAIVFFIPYILNNFNILCSLIYTFILLLPIIMQIYGFYSDLIINISNISSTGLLKHTKLIQEVIRQQKASKVVKFLMMLTRLKLHSNNPLDTFNKDSILKHRYDDSDMKIRNEIDEISKIFDFYDIDKSGEIDRDEMFSLMSTLGFQLNENEQEAAFQAVDLDNSGSISKQEFIQWHLFHRNLDHGNKYENLKEIAKEIFKTIDEDNSGEVTTQEFQNALNKLNAGLSTDEIAGIIRDFDEDGSGTISLEEFVTFIEKSATIS